MLAMLLKKDVQKAKSRWTSLNGARSWTFIWRQSRGKRATSATNATNAPTGQTDQTTYGDPAPKRTRTVETNQGKGVENLREHATNVVNGLILSSGVVLEVGVRGPVGRLVRSDGTRGAVAGDEGLIGRNLAESCAVAR